MPLPSSRQITCPRHTGPSHCTDDCTSGQYDQSEASSNASRENPDSSPELNVNIREGSTVPSPGSKTGEFSQTYHYQGSDGERVGILFGCNVDSDGTTVESAMIEKFENASADAEGVPIFGQGTFNDLYRAKVKQRRIAGSIEMLRVLRTQVLTELPTGGISNGLPSWVEERHVERIADRLSKAPP